MTKLFIFCLLFLSNIMFGQALKIDTIDYSTMLSKKSYYLVKVKSKSSKEVVHDHEVVFFTYRVEKLADIEPKWATTIKMQDTLMWADWDYERGIEPVKTHSCGKITLNPKTNIIVLEKYIWSKKKTITRKFKVLKWTNHQIVLRDHSNVDLQRIYAFE